MLSSFTNNTILLLLFNYIHVLLIKLTFSTEHPRPQNRGSLCKQCCQKPYSNCFKCPFHFLNNSVFLFSHDLIIRPSWKPLLLIIIYTSVLEYKPSVGPMLYKRLWCRQWFITVILLKCGQGSRRLLRTRTFGKSFIIQFPLFLSPDTKYIILNYNMTLVRDFVSAYSRWWIHTLCHKQVNHTRKQAQTNKPVSAVRPNCKQ